MELVTVFPEHDLEPGDLRGDGGTGQAQQDDPGVRELPAHQQFPKVQIRGHDDPPFAPRDLEDLLITDGSGVVAGHNRDIVALCGQKRDQPEIGGLVEEELQRLCLLPGPDPPSGHMPASPRRRGA